MSKAFTLNEAFHHITDHWQPVNVAYVNDSVVRAAKIKGSYHWHRHEQEDELFWVVKGAMDIHLRDDTISLHEGECYVVPKGVEHKPVAQEEAWILMLEPSTTISQGS